jgi:hypothetical protein
LRHEQAMDRRQRGGENAFRFVDMAIGELRSREEALDSGARRARDSLRTAPHLKDAAGTMGLRVLNYRHKEFGAVSGHDGEV